MYDWLSCVALKVLCTHALQRSCWSVGSVMLTQPRAVLGKGDAESVNPVVLQIERDGFWSQSPEGVEEKPSYRLVVLVGPGSWLSLHLLPCHVLASPKLWGVAKTSPYRCCSSLLSTHCRESNCWLVVSKYMDSNDRISSSWLRVQSHPNQNFVLLWLRNTAFSSEQFPWGQIQTAHYKQKDARAQ